MRCYRQLAAWVLVAVVSAWSGAAEDPFAVVRSPVNLALPAAAGTWWVAQGGDTLNVNHHMAVPAQHYGVDLVLTRERRLHAGDGKRLEDWYSFDQDLLAPCAGRVVSVVDGQADQALGTTDAGKPFGNVVVIRAAERAWVVLAHCRQNSIAVQAGESVVRGQRLARIGNSGNTTFPHVHMHIQDTPHLGQGQGLLFLMQNVRAEIAGTVLNVVPVPMVRGMWLEAVPAR